MVKPILAKEVARKAASLGETLVSGTAGNGAMKASALEAKIVPGRLPTLRKRKEADPKALAKNPRKGIPVRGDRALESAAGQEQGRNPRSELRDSA